jgi:hypothetical protein
MRRHNGTSASNTRNWNLLKDLRFSNCPLKRQPGRVTRLKCSMRSRIDLAAGKEEADWYRALHLPAQP